MSLSKTYAALILFVSLIIGMWWLVSFQYSMKWDIMDITLPWNHFISESLSAGELPLWNPYLKNGFPIMGLPDTWYPITWVISLLFGMDVWGIQLDYLFHLFIAGFGMFIYSKFRKIDSYYSLALGVCYMFSGFMVSNAQHLGWVIGAAWLPWVFYYFESLIEGQRKLDLLKFSLITSLLFYGSYPPITIITAYVLLIKLILLAFNKYEFRTKKATINFGISFLLILLISSLGLLGLFELGPNLNRGAQLPLSNEGWGVLSGFLPLEAISSWVVPYAGNSVEGFWGSDISLINCYFGFLALLILGCGLFARVKQTWIYFGIGILFLMIAMSEVFPFRAWLYHLPMFDKFRFPSLFRLFAIFFFLLASGFAYTEVRNIRSVEKAIKYVIGFTFFIIGALFFITFLRSELSFADSINSGLQSFNRACSFYDKASVNLFIHVVLIGSLGLSSFLTRRWFKYVPIFIIIEVLIISQFNISETVIHFGDPKIGNLEIQKYEDSKINIDLTKSMNTFDDGYWKEELSWFRYNQASITKTPSASGNSPFSLIKTKDAKENGDFVINNYPLFFLAEVIDQKVVESLIDKRSFEKISMISAVHNEYILRVNCETETNLIFLQNNYEGWRVTVNEIPADIEIVNTTFMSLSLNDGESLVRFYFKPTKTILAFWISLVSFFSTMIGIAWFEIRKDKT